MRHAIIRQIIANWRGRLGQTALLFLIMMVTTTLLVLAVGVQRAAADPWERTYRETNGAHLWLTSPEVTVLRQIREMSDVVAATEPLPLVNGFGGKLKLDHYPQPVVLLARATNRASDVGQMVLLDGRWVTDERIDEVVIDKQLALDVGLIVGDAITLRHGEHTLQASLVGIVYNPSLIPCPQERSGVCSMSNQHTLYTVPAAFDQLAYHSEDLFWVMGLQIANPEAVDYFKTQITQALGPDAPWGSLTWQRLRDYYVAGIQYQQVLLRVFSFLAIGLAAFILANTVSGQILADFRTIGLLKAIGLKPGQVTGLYLLMSGLLGLLAAVSGLALAWWLLPELVGRAAEALNATGVPLLTWGHTTFILLTILGTVTLATLIPAWRAGQQSIVQAITTGYEASEGQLSGLARWATAWHLPPVVVFGLKNVLAQPIRAFLTVLVIVTGVITMTFALSAESTIQRALSDPSLFGYLPVDLLVDTGLGGDNEAVSQVLSRQSGVAGYVTNGFLAAVRDNTQTVFRVRAMAGDTTLIFPARQGRRVMAPGEAMVSQALAKAFGLGVGDEMRLWFGTTAVPVTIVGTYGESADDPPTVLMLAETVTAVGIPVSVTQFGIKAVPNIGHRQLERQLGQALRTATEQFTPVFNLHDLLALDIMEIRGIMLALNLVLLGVVVVNLLITSSLAVRERFRELGIMKVLGLTPGQVSRTVWVDNIALGLVALLVGMPLGLWGTERLITAVSQQIGLDQGIARLPDVPMLLLMVPLVLMIVTIGCLLPARRAGRMSVVAALRVE